MRTVETDAVRTRLLLPILLPLASAAALFFYVVNLSRVLLAGGEWGSLLVASLLVLAILGTVAWISMHPGLRASTLTVVAVGLMLLVGAAGLTCLGPSQPAPSAAASAPPTGDPVATVDVEALANMKFQSDHFDTVAGVNQIRYSGAPGHTLAFSDEALAGFELATGARSADTGKVVLEPGTYTIYCTISGHRAQGMRATITVS
jgi:plastocyanin